MFKNYVKVVWRGLKRHKVYSFVNVFGLSVGLACSMLILVAMDHQLAYDRFHEKGDRIYRMGREITSAEGEMREPMSSAPAAAAIKQDCPEVAETVRFKGMGKVVVRRGDLQFYETDMYFADQSVFDVFTYPLAAGDSKTALSKPYTIVITRDMAEKYFGSEDPMHQVLTLNHRDDFMVTGVMENLPITTHREIHMLCSFETLVAQDRPDLKDWLGFNYSTYVLLNQGVSVESIEARFPEMIKQYIGEGTKNFAGTLGFYMLPLKKIYLYSNLDGNPPGLITEVFFYGLLAVCTILIACINFVNLTTARSSARAKEIGLRKTVGASRSMLIKQFLSEALVLSILALGVAFVMVEMLLPSFSNNVGLRLTMGITEKPQLYAGFFALAVLVGLVSGMFPALVLSRLRPVQALKSGMPSGPQKSRLRSALVVVQFVLSISLIAQTMALNLQIRYLEKKDIGFHKRDVLVLPVLDDAIRGSMRTFKKELARDRDILSVASISSLPGLGIPRSVKIPEGYLKTEMQLMDEVDVDSDFIPALDVRMASGRNFFEDDPADQRGSVIVNELAVRKFKWKNPIGRTIQYSVGQDQYAEAVVVGVVKDFHLSSMHRVIEPLFIGNRPGNLRYILVRARPGKTAAALESVRETWKRIFPDQPFEYKLLEDEYDRYFRTLEKVRQIITVFSILAVLLACLGIFALAAFIAERRTKEIGIRKVLGDTTPGIVFRLNFQLLKYVLFAVVFLVPLIFLGRNVMGSFLPYTVKISWFLHVKAALLVFVVAWLSISYQSIRSALANPSDSLRYE